MMVVRRAARRYNLGMRFGVVLLGEVFAIACCMVGCDRDDSGRRMPAATKPAQSPPVSVAPVAEAGWSDAAEAEPESPLANTVADDAVEPLPTPVTTQPARPTSQAASLPAFQPLNDAKVGEWAIYQGLDSQRLRYEVREVSLSRVKTEVTVTQDGRPLGMPAVREDLRAADPLAWETPADGRRQTSRVTIHTAGRDWDAILYEDQWTDEGIRYVRRTWIGKDAPIFGIIRMELIGDKTLEAKMELVETGG